MTTKYTLHITKADFDALKPGIRADLEKWWQGHQASLTPPPTNPSTAAVWDNVPVVDSKTIARASPVVRKYLGVGINPKLIRKGGYGSFDEAVDDVLQKIRSTCPDTSDVAVDVALQ